MIDLGVSGVSSGPLNQCQLMGHSIFPLGLGNLVVLTFGPFYIFSSIDVPMA